MADRKHEETLKKLDKTLAEHMLEALEAKDGDLLKGMGTVVTYLKNNSVITKPEKGRTIEDEIKNVIK